ncbi:hypothetical protein TNCV_1340201 [Trichonephila clavipes]|uniref:Uncharacterized protein n=1 Tax=Trichonephila clavipes TaxID=2585209 RepID=A0A8X6R6J7_TRICX|nr:hypothetical protein TNCV_1340201 [Trichonephila clavipes]
MVSNSALTTHVKSRLRICRVIFNVDIVAIVQPLRLGGTVNSRRATSPLVRLVKGEEKWEAPQGVVKCMVLKVTDKDSGKNSVPYRDEFRGP